MILHLMLLSLEALTLAKLKEKKNHILKVGIRNILGQTFLYTRNEIDEYKPSCIHFLCVFFFFFNKNQNQNTLHSSH